MQMVKYLNQHSFKYLGICNVLNDRESTSAQLYSQLHNDDANFFKSHRFKFMVLKIIVPFVKKQ